ncbi:MAG: homocysteine S-methyltransferase family protein [Pleurocapsa sp. MO_226.B13]|nr:homocysteine S-methyltransferase family protein [Pleurocapsa sp. MO_226.B13]
MAKYRHNLPQLSERLFLTDGGTETTLIFHQGHNLPYFAAFDLLKDSFGYHSILKYFRNYARLAQKYRVGFILESVTWRANQDWGAKLGYSSIDLAAFNHLAIALLEDIRDEYENDKTPMVISGCIGPRGDGYNPTELMSEKEAEYYHTDQIETFAQTNADLVTAMTITYPEEAIGIARAAQKAKMPVVISFTVETDGKLPTGHSLPEAIAFVDRATDYAPIYYMINCAHPMHFAPVFQSKGDWLKRIKAIRANASIKSHAELDEAEELDDGNPIELGIHYQKLKSLLPDLNILGGCCGTDIRHIEEIAKATLALL